MRAEFSITEEAWAEFEAIIERHIAGGVFYLEKDLLLFAELHGWQAILATSEKHEFQRRARVLQRYASHRSHWTQRLEQLRRMDAEQVGKFRYQIKWVYRAGAPFHCELHQRFDGVALPPDHPFWSHFYPPNGWMCGCHVGAGYLPSAIKRLGANEEVQLPSDWADVEPQTGLPRGIQPGFDGQTMPTLFEFFQTVVAGTDYRWDPLNQ